jgi:lipoprotein-anchoring transpeptidase ErfK/SrfK
VWRQLGELLPRTRYRLSASATNADGEVTTRSWRLRTPAPAVTDLPDVTPLDGGTVGVGHPVVVYFHHDVTDKGLVEQRMDISTSQPVEGSWGWLDDRTVAWRPREFWPAETDVDLTLALAKTELGGGVWVMEDREIDFHVGRSQVLRIDDATHSMQVQRAEGVVRTVDVSMGKPGFTTRSGTKVIMTREVSRRMDSATVNIGGDEAYDLDVPYAMRLTSTGEFIHGAPWSEDAQGIENVSHGCTNVSLEDAIWLYDNTLIGDPVVTNGTGRDMEEWNGLGGLWNYTWDEWQQR